MAVATAAFVVLGRRFGLPVVRWTITGVTGSLLLAGVALWVLF